MKTFFQIMGIIYTILLTISIILYIVNTIKNRINTKAFEKSIRNSDGIKKTFTKLDSDSLDKLHKTNNVTEKTIDLESQNNNSNTIVEKFKDYQIEDMNNFINKLTDQLKMYTGDNTCTINDWYSIVRKDGLCLDKFTFEVHSNNIFVVFGKLEAIKGKVVSNICCFKSIEDFTDLIVNHYDCERIVKD